MPGVARDTVIYFGRYHNTSDSDVSLAIETQANGILQEYSVHFDLDSPEEVSLIRGDISDSINFVGRRLLTYVLPARTGIVIYLTCSFDVAAIATAITENTTVTPAIF
jgi:hypothetical protein